MKRSCKNIDITDANTIKPWVTDCCYRHYRRYDFKHLFRRFGMSREDYRRMYETYDKSLLEETINRISEYCAKSIKNRDITLSPVHIREMRDRTTDKIRLIGRESALQQVYDYIAVYSAMDIFKRRLVKEQCSSIPNRGQVYGMRMIKKWVKSDYDSMRYANKHGIDYSRKCKYFVKLDIQKCYPTANTSIFLNLFERDCGNGDIFWLWSKLILSHRVDGYAGFMIGALPSQWASQYMMSFIYRFAKNKYSLRRGKRITTVKHMLLFMDDMVLFGSNRKQLKRTVEYIIQYTKSELGWTIKPDWHIRCIDDFNIDMMGYVIRKDGSITIRGRNFIKARRLALRHKKRYSITQARRLISYKGFFDYSDSKQVIKKYQFNRCFNDAKKTISNYERRKLCQKSLKFT